MFRRRLLRQTLAMLKPARTGSELLGVPRNPFGPAPSWSLSGWMGGFSFMDDVGEVWLEYWSASGLGSVGPRALHTYST